MFTVNFEPVFNNPGSETDISHTLDLSDLSFNGEHPFQTPAVVSGVIRNDTGIVSSDAVITVLYSGNCDRCAKEVSREYSIPMEHTFVTELNDNDNDEFILLSDLRFDLDGLATEDVILGLPGKFLCREDCKGICPSCGRDLNDGPCNCRPEVDPRLAGLLSLLTDE